MGKTCQSGWCWSIKSSAGVWQFLNLLTWPISVVWGIPEAAIDAETINERELVYYYTFDESGKEALKAKGLKLTASGRLVPLDEK